MKKITVNLLILAIGGLLVSGCEQGSETAVEKPALKTTIEKEVRMKATDERMAEWNDWKFGLFIHWGPWSQSQIGPIWRGRGKGNTDILNEKIVQGYLDMNKTFNPVKFDPAKWARTAKQAGMKYVVFTTKHHDGFCNFDSDFTDYKVTSPDCPYSTNENADITKHLVDAFRAEGFKIGFYFSHPDQHHADGYWWHRHLNFDPNFVANHPDAWERFYQFEKAQVKELMTKYGPLDIFWFDIMWPTGSYGGPYSDPIVKADSIEMIRMMRKMDPEMIINNRGVDIYGDFATPEQRIPEMGIPGRWEANITISNDRGFWYKGPDVTFKSSEELILMLVDIASKGGNFLMNVGPQPDGRFAPGEIKSLRGMGGWVRTNAESIYGTTRTPFRHLDWGKCTVKDNKLFLHVLDWPADGILVVPGLRNEVTKAYLLADKRQKALKVSKKKGQLQILVPAEAPDKTDTVIVLEIQGAPDVDNTIRQNSAGNIELQSGEATVHGEITHYYSGAGTKGGNYIKDWTSESEWLSWDFEVDKPGTFEVQFTYALQNRKSGGNFKLEVAGNRLKGQIKSETKNFNKFKDNTFGKITLGKKGSYTLSLKPDAIAGGDLMYLRNIKLTKEND